MTDAVIGFWGGLALLISSITGPGLTTIPLLFQQAGWLTPTIAFLLFGVLSGVISFFLVETMSSIRGNEKFQARVEYSTVAHLYLGKKAHIIMLLLLYCALQSVNISSIILSEQTMDSLLIRLFHKTCALSFTQGWVCVSTIDSAGSPFDSYILFSFGYLISAALVLPLSIMSLVQNIKFQLASITALFIVMAIWIYIFASHGLNQSVPVIGNDQGTLVGFVISNFAFITTVPSFINELSRSVSIHKSIAIPIAVCVFLYIFIGLIGASSFQITQSSDILATLSASDENKVLIAIVNILFPIAVLITSIPVFAIVIRYNLVRGNFCSNKWAIVWASLMPWVLIIPFQTKGWLLSVMNWTSLIFGSSTNFIIPLLLYLSSKIYSASTADTTGGDLFVLHRDPSVRSINSHQRSSRSPNTRLGVNQLPFSMPRPGEDVGEQFSANTSPESDREPICDSPTTFLLAVTSPVGSPSAPSFTNVGYPGKDTIEESDITDYGQASGSAQASSSIPLRVVYSPAVLRSPSSGQSSSVQRQFPIENIDTDVKNHRQTSLSENPFAGGVSFDIPPSPSRGVYRRSRHNSTTSNAEARSQVNARLARSSESISSRGTERGPISSQEERSELEIDQRPVFRALPERKWFQSAVVAKVALAVVTCCVLGNLIYTIIQTARGNDPLGG